MSRSSAPALPRQFHYSRSLAHTASSDVYLATRRDLGSEPVALKILRFGVDDEQRELFVEGNRLAAELHHPNVIEVLDSGEFPDGRLWVATPYYARGSLAAHTSPDALLPPDDVLHIGVRVADVLDMLHGERALHRDVKPANILRGDDGEPVLTDLNGAGRMHAHTGTLTTTLGTLAYTAPEVTASGRYGVPSEVYALGITLLELLAGGLPRRTEHLPEADDGELREPDLGPNLPAPPPELATLLAAMTAPDPARRPSSTGEVARVLRGVQHDLDAPVTGPTVPFAQTRRLPAPRPTRPRTLGRRAFLGAGVAVAAAGVLGAIRFSGDTAPPDDRTAPAPVDGGPGPFRVTELPAVAPVGLFQPWGLAVSPDGRYLLVADSNNRVVRRRRLDAPVVETVAGRGAPGPAGSLLLDYPCGLAVRRDGAFYVSDSVRHTVHLVQPDGAALRVAGSGSPGFSGDGGPGTTAQLQGPHGLAVAANGDLYIADTDNNRVRLLDTDGLISTVAGVGTEEGTLGDGGPAVDAVVYAPEGLCFGDGALYVTQWKDCRIRRVERDGTITAVAGTGPLGFSGDGGAAGVAQLSGPGGPSSGPSGDLVFADMNNNRVRRISPAGTITTVAGSGQRGRSQAGVPAVDASLANPIATATGPGGEIYFCEYMNSRVLMIRPDGTLAVVLE